MTKAFSVSRTQDGAKCVKGWLAEDVLLREERQTGCKTLMAQSLQLKPPSTKLPTTAAGTRRAVLWLAVLRTITTYVLCPACIVARPQEGRINWQPMW
jgi:hypothetical protein